MAEVYFHLSVSQGFWCPNYKSSMDISAILKFCHCISQYVNMDAKGKLEGARQQGLQQLRQWLIGHKLDSDITIWIHQLQFVLKIPSLESNHCLL